MRAQKKKKKIKVMDDAKQKRGRNEDMMIKCHIYKFM